MIERDIAKSDRTKCEHCSFEGTPIPKGAIRFKVLTAYEFYGKCQSRRFYLCEDCGLRYLQEHVRELQKLIRPNPRHQSYYEEIPF